MPLLHRWKQWRVQCVGVRGASILSVFAVEPGCGQRHLLAVRDAFLCARLHSLCAALAALHASRQQPWWSTSTLAE